MKYYNTIQTVEVDKESIRRANNFANSVIQTINYSDCNQLTIHKIKDDHFISKIGEEATKLVLTTYGTVDGPDYRIYNGKEKSWDHDLFMQDTGIAVKTQRRTAAKKYTLSWTFQCGTIRRDFILKKPEEWVVFVEYDDLQPYRCFVYPPYQIKELTFKDPKLAYLKGHKKVVYADTLSILS